MASHKTTIKGRYIGGKLFEPSEDKLQYSAVIILDESSIAKIEAIRDSSIKDKWTKRPSKLADWTIREGDDEEFSNSFGEQFINPKCKRMPKLFTKKKKVLTEITEADNLIYAGCYVYAVVDAYSYDANKESKSPAGTTLGLQNLVFWKHGEPLGFDGNPDDDDYSEMESELDDIDGDDDDDEFV